MSAVDVALNPICEETLRSAGYIDSRLALCSNESILIYITVSGSLIPIRVMESDSIASVKLRIQSYQGFVVKRQKLVFGGRELSRSDSLVKEYGVTKGNVLHLVLKLSDLLLINVWTTSGEEFEFHVDRHKNIGYLKRRIAKKGKDFVSLEDPELFCNGEKLEDQRLIDDISKNTDAVIHLVVQKSAKLQAEPVEKNVKLSIVAINSKGRTDDDHQAHESNKPLRELQVLSRAHESNKPLRELQVLSSKPTDKNSLLEPIFINPNTKFPSFIWDMINSASDGLARGRKPIRSSEGMGGTYFMQDISGNKYVAIFKPTDEEPMAVNNPHGLPLSVNGEGLKRGTRVGEGALREVAAFVLDHPKTGPRSLSSGGIGFSCVPPTLMVKCMHKGSIKIGSLQMFKKNFGSCEDMGPQDFPVEEVHKISVFDIRTANADRHAGNILWSKDGEEGRIVLIPIDHGYCLPENFEDCTFDWLYWPQARQPFSSETIEYIRSLDAEQDIALLNLYGWDLSPECARILRVSTMLLKKGAEKGLSPFAIGSIICRESLNKKSVIEETVEEAEDSMLPGMSEIAFLECVSEIMDSVLGKLIQCY